jgi:hypothetical protein
VDSSCPTLSPPIIRKSDFASKIVSDLQSTCFRSLGLQRSHGRLDLFVQGFTSHPLGHVAYAPSRSLRPTAAPISTAPCLMSLLPVDDLCGPIFSGSLRPWCLTGRFRPLHLRVDDPMLCHCTSGRGDPGLRGHSRRVLWPS